MVGYSAFDPKMCQKTGVGRKKTLKTTLRVREYHVYTIIWNPLVGECLQCVKEPAKEVDKNTVAVVCTNSHSKEEVVDHVQQKYS